MFDPQQALLDLQRAMPEQSCLESHLQIACDFAKRWRVELEEVLPGATCSVTIAGRLPGGDKVVLRVPMSDEEATSGLKALRAFDQRGGVELIESDDETGSILMPRLLPGSCLEDSDLTEEQKLDVTAKLSLGLQSAPDLGVWTHERWFQELWSFELPKDSPVDPDLFAIGKGLARQLLDTTGRRTVLHGDLHHYNILRHGDKWIAIDPKGILADPAFEPVAFLRNPVDTLAQDPDLVARQARRITRFAERLGEPAERIWGWAVAQICLDAAWSNGDWSVAWAKVAMASYEACARR